MSSSLRNLVLVLGDQLDSNSAAFDDFDAECDAVWMAECDEELTHVWCHKLRIAAFLSAMRHFRNELQENGLAVQYHRLHADRRTDSGRSFAEILTASVNRSRPDKLIVLEPGDYRVRQSLIETAEALAIEIEIRPDRHFYSTPEEFRQWADGRKSLTLEYWYRALRKKHKVLVDDDEQPTGGDWNFDAENRDAFPKSGPGKIKAPRQFRIDSVTEDVLELVQERYPEHPGSIEHFDFPTTHAQALELLRDFIEHRLPLFGKYEDAMWSGRPFLYHSRLSFALNAHLLTPQKCVESAIDAYESGHAPINSVEGFVRQILGWREFVRGVYWLKMPEYAELNALDCDDVDVPSFFWDGQTEMACMADGMKSVVDHAWSHHIVRLMVLGQFAMLYGVHPYRFHEWHMAMYSDAIDWASLPNTLGMSQFGDGGIVGTKPYCASGNYIDKMSNHCSGCRYDRKKSHDDDACPVTTLYWSFLDRHQERFEGNHRMGFQLKNLKRKSDEEIGKIREREAELRSMIESGERI